MQVVLSSAKHLNKQLNLFFEYAFISLSVSIPVSYWTIFFFEIAITLGTDV